MKRLKGEGNGLRGDWFVDSAVGINGRSCEGRYEGFFVGGRCVYLSSLA